MYTFSLTFLLSTQVYLFFGHLALSIFAAIGASLLFESPFIGLEKLLFGRGGREGRGGQGLKNGGPPTLREGEPATESDTVTEDKRRDDASNTAGKESVA